MLAVISLFIGTRADWDKAIVTRPATAVVISLCYAAILACGILALVVRRRAALTRVDAGVLLTAIALTVCSYQLSRGPSTSRRSSPRPRTSCCGGTTSTARTGPRPCTGPTWASPI